MSGSQNNLTDACIADLEKSQWVRMHSLSINAINLPQPCDAMRVRVRAHLKDEIERGSFDPDSTTWASFDPEFARRFAKAGFLGVTWPEQFGGQALSFLERYVILEELLAHRAPVGAFWIGERQSGHQILRFSQDAVKQALLPRIVAGEISFGIGMSEPNSGSDLASVQTRAVKNDDKWTLNGAKVWTTNADKVDYLLVLARTGDAGQSRHEGLTQFIVDMRTRGISVAPIADMSGGSEFCEVVFDNVTVPAEMILGTPGEGWTIVTAELAFERSGPERFLSAYGLLQKYLDVAASDRSESNVKKLGEIVGDLLVLRQMSLGVAGMLEAGQNPNVQAALVKDLGNAFEQRIPELTRTALDRFNETEHMRAFQDHLDQTILSAPSWSIRGGTREITRGIIAAGLELR